MNQTLQPYYVIAPSPWPFLRGVSVAVLALGFSWGLSCRAWVGVLTRALLLGLFRASWWRDIRREGRLNGTQSETFLPVLRWGVLLFISSEVLLFFSFFWGYLHLRLAPSLRVGRNWPPVGLEAIPCFDLPLLNTLILLSSGVTITASHHSLILGKVSLGRAYLYWTIALGLYFRGVQGLEYLYCSFTLIDRAYGSIFFISTGAHGLHVIVGAIALGVRAVRLTQGQLNKARHFGYEAAVWYWHFVDVVWLVLFRLYYWWGGYRTLTLWFNIGPPYISLNPYRSISSSSPGFSRLN